MGDIGVWTQQHSATIDGMTLQLQSYKGPLITLHMGEYGETLDNMWKKGEICEPKGFPFGLQQKSLAFMCDSS